MCIFRENRLSHIIIFIMIGLSVIMTPILRKIPMPVLFGVFLYMGIAALKGIQFFDRILIMFMPNKYQPDYSFLRQVSFTHFTQWAFICWIRTFWFFRSVAISYNSEVLYAVFHANLFTYEFIFPQVPLKKVHLFTAIQVACLAILWVIKSFKQTSILFPLMVCQMK